MSSSEQPKRAPHGSGAARATAPPRRRDPGRTRELILQASGEVLSRDGPEGLSVSQVAALAGVNRGTAYQHFQTREQLLDATIAWVSARLCEEVFGDTTAETSLQMDPQHVSERLAAFAMENPALGRVWLLAAMNSDDPARDPFWARYEAQFRRFAASDLARPGIDVEVHTALMLVGVFLWPAWARRARDGKARREMARRFSDEVLRLCLFGTMRAERFPALVERLGARPGARESRI